MIRRPPLYFFAALFITHGAVALHGSVVPAAAQAAATVEASVMASASHLYHYRAAVTEVYDGDTLTVDIDLGLGVWLRGQKIRLFGIDAPELKGETKEAGQAARDWLREKVQGKSVLIKTFRDGREKYGRLLAEVWLEGEILSINDRLVHEGMAARRAW